MLFYIVDLQGLYGLKTSNKDGLNWGTHAISKLTILHFYPSVALGFHWSNSLNISPISFPVQHATRINTKK